MANRYGFDGNIPGAAIYGTYDFENGEWIGEFFDSLEDAQIAANELIDSAGLGVFNFGGDWIEPE